MKKLLFVMGVAVISVLTSCEKDDNRVTPSDEVVKIEKSMWTTEDGSPMEFIPQLNEMLVYGGAAPFAEEGSDELEVPMAFTYYLLNNGSARINNDNMKFKVQGKTLTIGDNTFTKAKRINTNVKEPMKGAINELWSDVVNGRYSVEFFDFGDADVSLSFIKDKALVIMRQDQSGPVQPRRFKFENDKLYLGNPKKEIGFILEAYNSDKVVLRADDDSENYMILYPIIY
ncbi:MAG: hypothetical protein MI866_08335 [Bacteroidales bacterium]|nr:hypothetical protein [Bacteroidales bacterium]